MTVLLPRCAAIVGHIIMLGSCFNFHLLTTNQPAEKSAHDNQLPEPTSQILFPAQTHSQPKYGCGLMMWW